MNPLLLKPEVQKFIREFEQKITTLAFSGSPFEGITVQELIIQVESRQKAQKKLPTWFKTDGILYPPKLNLEQTSSEKTAAYKASLLPSTSTIDVTGGFGIDTYYFSKQHNKVIHVERNESLAQLVIHNATILKKDNLTVHIGDGIELLKDKKFDLIYIDPSRRSDEKGKVFLLEDCEPNVPKLLPYLLKHSDRLLIKTSPMLDINVGLNELDYVKSIDIVAVDNEVKELLWIIEKHNVSPLIINTINLLNNENETFSFRYENEAIATYKLPQKYLYEPNAAILKSGGFKIVSSKLGVDKLHQHTHLYTNNELVKFPGRRFNIEAVIPYNKAEMRRGITFDKANITTRNFPESVQQLRKKWNIKDGGSIYLFFTTVENEKKMMLICSKIKK
ncbi:class I SAM-dependent methyltransferase [Patiriisocius marinus]|uniref:class I SAM-dependent methyltransferase n=1 Tax=Patiriisocius marinus TaxID=1397112 RepID=UPI00232E029A|nr:class I SAM-dependent methyltransferase [Patiriisocius marinus]